MKFKGLDRKPMAGDWVEVRSKEEILNTLDRNGEIEGMPFMPEMLAFCGRKMKVYKRAHKTCDTVFPVRSRKLNRSVHLEARCDGSAHGGCQAGCLLFWRQEWLKPIPSQGRNLHSITVPGGSVTQAARGCTEAQLRSQVSFPSPEDGVPAYKCQATRLPYMTSDLAWWDVRQYIEDYTSGNVGLWRIAKGLIYAGYYNLSEAGIGVGHPMRWLYSKIRWLWNGPMWPRQPGEIPPGQPTPASHLNLQPGELVRVKSHQEILRTVTTDGRNRGMTWDAELVPYCGGTYRVLWRVARFINEQTGRMQELQNPCVILDNVVCKASYSACRMFCPREIYSWWREVWLERVEPDPSSAPESERQLVTLSGQQ